MTSKDFELFIYLCEKGYLDVILYLLQSKPDIDIYAHNDRAFRMACIKNQINIALWFVDINPKKYTVIVNNGTITYSTITYFSVVKELNKHKDILYIDMQKIETCLICKDHLCDIQTSCNHTFCETCLTTWLKRYQNICPFCRNSLEEQSFHIIQPK